MHFADRADAGRRLATVVARRVAARPDLAGRSPVVLGLPRGGVPVAAYTCRGAPSCSVATTPSARWARRAMPGRIATPMPAATSDCIATTSSVV